jgi:hypothetical protein
MKVAIYHATVPGKKNQEKIDLLRFFAQGVTVSGDTCVDVRDQTLVDSDVAVIQGWITQDQDLRSHLSLRRRVIDTYLSQRRHVVAVDSNLFLYADPKNHHHYLRYSFNGVFPDCGIYCDRPSDPQRWQSISRDLGIGLKPYRTHGDHIVLLLQRNGGWSMGTLDVQEWANLVIDNLKHHTDRPIVVRAHPGDKAAREYLDPRNKSCRINWNKRVRLSTNPDLRQDLQGCWAVVNHNSSPVVAAAIEGYPVFVTDPNRSQCQEIANTDFAQIENPQLPDRQSWIERLAMSHWKFTEVQQGLTWRHMRQWI